MIKRNNSIIGVLLVTIGMMIGILTIIVRDKLIYTPSSETTTADDFFKDVKSLFELIEQNAYFYQNDVLLRDGAIRGVVDSLADPYSVYFSENEYLDFNNELNRELCGIGITTVINGSYPLIIKVNDNSPAEKAGLKTGDIIKFIDSKHVENLSSAEISNLIRGEKGVVRDIGVYQENPNHISYHKVTLDKIIVKTVNYTYEQIDKEIMGYLKIDSFGVNTFSELNQAMNDLVTIGIDKLIIDVRDNPGGLLSSVKEVLDYFINSNIPFMYSRTRDNSESKDYLNEIDKEIDYDIVILINEYSASAAEIFAVTMYELGGYDLVGTTTYGKGTMQIIYTINNGSIIVKLTTGIWLTPSKEWIQDIGVKPTKEVKRNGQFYLVDSYKDISYDIVNDEVKKVQLFLKSKYHYDIRTDGYFDRITENAVKDYQLNNRLLVTGYIDHNTAYYINIELIKEWFDLKNDTQYLAAKAHLNE